MEKLGSTLCISRIQQEKVLKLVAPLLLNNGAIKAGCHCLLLSAEWRTLKPVLRLLCTIKDVKRWILASLVDDHRTVQGTSTLLSISCNLHMKTLHHHLCCYSIEQQHLILGSLLQPGKSLTSLPGLTTYTVPTPHVSLLVWFILRVSRSGRNNQESNDVQLNAQMNCSDVWGVAQIKIRRPQERLGESRKEQIHSVHSFCFREN